MSYTRTNNTERFWNRLADRYAAKPVPDQAVYERKLALTRAVLHPEARVLEVGCGTGSTAIALEPHVGSILATDLSARMIGIAREKAGAASAAGVMFKQEPARQSLDAASELDAVLAHSLLHLLTDWRDVLVQAHRALNPGGVLVLSTVCLRDGFGFMRPIAPVGRWLGLLPTLSFFTRVQLEGAIEAAGFVVEQSWLPGAKRGMFHVARKPT